MEYELRDYAVKAGEMENWLREWKAKIRPLREKFGFGTLGAWTIMEENRFVWILGYDGPTKSFAEADLAYYDSDERKSMAPNPAGHLDKTDSWKMRSIL